MSLGKTLLKVAIGVAIVKGVSTLAKGGTGSGGASTAGRGTPYGDSGKGGLEDLLNDVISGGAPGGRTSDPKGGRTRGESSGGGDLLDQVLGDRPSGTKAGRTAGSSRDVDDIGMHTPTPRPPSPASRRSVPDADDGRIFTPTPRPPRRNAPKGGLEDLLRGDSADTGAGGAAPDGLGGLLETILGSAGPRTLPEPKARQEELAAALALRAMIQAAKCDGELDDAERGKLTGQLGDATREEVAFVNAELQRPVDVQGLARQVPNGMEEQVYIVSLMAIDLDNRREAEYLAALAQALELSAAEVNRLHDRMGAPHIFR